MDVCVNKRFRALFSFVNKCFCWQMFRLFQWSNVKTPKLKMREKSLDLYFPTVTGMGLRLSVIQAISWLEQRQLPVEKITPGFLQNQLVRKVRLPVGFGFLVCWKCFSWNRATWCSSDFMGEDRRKGVEYRRTYLIQRIRSLHSKESCSIRLE